MRVIDYTCRIPPQRGVSVQYRNPVFYSGPERGDFVCSDNPKIIADYAAKGIPEWQGYVEKPVIKTVKPEKVIPTIPDDWHSLSWPKKRAMAMSFTNEKIINKSFAEVVLEEAYNKQQSKE